MKILKIKMHEFTRKENVTNVTFYFNSTYAAKSVTR